MVDFVPCHQLVQRPIRILRSKRFCGVSCVFRRVNAWKLGQSEEMKEGRGESTPFLSLLAQYPHRQKAKVTQNPNENAC